MTGSSRKGTDAQCPFYHYDLGKHQKRIACEGIVDKSILELRFERIRDYKKQLEVFCCDHYKNCEVYRMLMQYKYDEEV